MESALVTGASSMIGSALVKDLLEHGVRVTALVRPKSKKTENLPVSSLVNIVECDIGDIEFVAAEGYDALFHLAWQGTGGYARNDFNLQRENVRSALKTLDFANKCGVKVFVTAGSQAEYGKPETVLRPDTPLNPLSEYGRAKALTAQLCRERCKEYGMVHIHARILSVYGEGDNPFTLVSSAISAMQKNEETFFTDCGQMWDYLYCGDCAEALRLAAEKTSESKTYVVGSGECRPLREYVEIIAEETDYKREIGFGKIKRSAESPAYLCADISELKKTGFVPRTDFRSGIRKILGSDRIEY